MYNISTLNPIKIAVVFLNMVSIPVHVLSAGVFYNALNTKTVASLSKGSYLYVYINSWQQLSTLILFTNRCKCNLIDNHSIEYVLCFTRTLIVCLCTSHRKHLDSFDKILI